MHLLRYARDKFKHAAYAGVFLGLAVLSVGAVLAGILFAPAFIEAETAGAFWRGSLALDEHLMHAMHEVPLWVKLSATVVMLIGLALAAWAYLIDTTLPARVSATFQGPVLPE